MATKLALYGELTFWPVRFAKSLRASRQLLKTSPVDSGSPDYNVASLSGGQHNVFAGGGRACNTSGI
jgi:hypothetical protein